MSSKLWSPSPHVHCCGYALTYNGDGILRRHECPQRETCKRHVAPDPLPPMFSNLMMGSHESLGDCPDYVELNEVAEHDAQASV